MDLLVKKRCSIKKGNEYKTEIKNVIVDYRWFYKNGNMKSNKHSLSVYENQLKYNNIIYNITLLLPKKHIKEIKNIIGCMTCHYWINVNNKNRKDLGNLICRFQILHITDPLGKYDRYAKIGTLLTPLKDIIPPEIFNDDGTDVFDDYNPFDYFADLAY